MKFLSGILILLLSSAVTAQTNDSGQTLSAYEILELVDRQLIYPEGLTKFQLTVTSEKGAVRAYKGTMFKKNRDNLFHFDSIGKGRLIKALFNENGQSIFAYDMLSRQLYHKRAGDRFDRVLQSGFCYYDLGNAPLMENYTPKISGKEKEDGNEYLRLEAIPLDKGDYSKIHILVDSSKNFSLKRINYFDNSGVLSKSLQIKTGQYPIREQRMTTVDFAAKREMLDLARGTITSLEFLITDRTARLDDSLFKKENIEK